MTLKPPIIKLEDERPASKGSGVCFYCHKKVGKRHADDCVLWTRPVTIRLSVEYIIEVPHFWDKDRIEFHRNDSSWCAGNALDELDDRFASENPCLCSAAVFEYVGEVEGSDADI